MDDDRSGFLRRLWQLLRPLPAARPEAGTKREELRHAVREAEAGLPPGRQAMLLGILELDKVTVNDIMIPRSEVIGIDLEDSLDQILAQLRSTPHTRLPVYRHDLNQIEGVLHMRRLARLLTHSPLTREALLGTCASPYFVPENTPLSTQLINFQKHKRRMAMVVDEYGEVIGLVTLEDILEEIVGEFTTSPASPDEVAIQAQEDGSYLIDGGAHLREINRALGWHLPCDGPRTLNGLITEALESIPDSHLCLKIGPYRLEILESADNRVKRARIWHNGAAASRS